MKKICWITSDNFFDVDINIVPYLVDKLYITWIVVFRATDCFYKEDTIKEIANKYNIKLVIFQHHYRGRNPLIIKEFLKKISIIRKTNADVVYVNYLGFPYLFPMLYFCKVKNVIYALHDFIDHVNIKHRSFIVLYKKFIFKHFDNFHLFSKEQYCAFVSTYINKKTFYAPLNLIDFGSSKLLPPNDKIIFLFFGVLRGNKGIEILIEVGNLLYESYPDKFLMRISGYTNNWKKFEKLIKYKAAFQVDIRKIDNEEIPDLYCSSHYLILPYLDVTQSGPLLISYNYTLPVIASELDGFKKYIESGENGYLFKKGDKKAFFRCMENVILNHQTTYSVIKSNLKNYIEKEISLESTVKHYLDFFDKF